MEIRLQYGMKLPGIFKRKSKETVNNRGNTDLGRTTQFRGVLDQTRKRASTLSRTEKTTYTSLDRRD
jgi:hypothetical protein